MYIRDGLTTFVFLVIGEQTAETSVMLTTLTTPTTTPTTTPATKPTRTIQKVYPAG